MWSELFSLNKEALLSEMDAFINTFNRFKQMLITDDIDGMREEMRQATARRELFDKPKTN
jgi:prephenate dehydrogenase